MPREYANSAMPASPGSARPAAGPIVRPERRLLGIAMMVGAVGFFAVLDTLTKTLTAHFDTGQILFGRFLFFAMALSVTLRRLGWRTLVGTRQPRLQILRAAEMMASTVVYTVALIYLPIATAISIGFFWPLAVTVLAIPMLGERVGANRWAAVALGFAAVVAIIRPGAEVFHWASLLPVLSGTLYACFQIHARILSRTDNATTTLFYSTALSLAVFSVWAPFVWKSPSLDQWLMMAGTGLVAFLGHYLLIKAIEVAPASLLAPFGYAKLVFGLVLGFLVFGDFPDTVTLAAAGVLTLTGIYISYRERTAGKLDDGR
ncbi:MAG: DMT family transporter [Alphaproteobacteria bacterium]